MLAFSKLNFDLYLKSGAKLAVREGYEQLQKAGWEPTENYHPVDKTWMLRRNGATIWYDPSHEFDWKAKVGVNEYGMDGNIESMTRDVDEMLAEILDKKLAFHNALHLFSETFEEQNDDDFYNGVVR